VSKKPARQKARPRPRTEILGVSVKRLAQGAVEQLERPIADEHAAIARPSRAIDILAAMERRGVANVCHAPTIKQLLIATEIEVATAPGAAAGDPP
jgi:hypothetical protein